MPHSKERGFRRFFGSRLFLLLGLLVAMLFAFGFARAYYQDYKIRRQIEALQEEVQTKSNRKLELLELIKWVNSPEFAEEKARTELNMKEPGEEVLVITNLDNGGQKELLPGAEDIPLNNPIKWWYYFTRHKLTIN